MNVPATGRAVATAPWCERRQLGYITVIANLIAVHVDRAGGHDLRRGGSATLANGGNGQFFDSTVGFGSVDKATPRARRTPA